MANLKITELTALSAQPADGDLIPIVDISDPTDSANGTTKKITAVNLIPDASTTVEGKVLTTTSSNTVVSTDDTRVPSQGENDALAGGGDFGTPSSTNKFLTEDYYTAIDSPVVRTYEWGATVGADTTRFDITNPSGSTFRYTYDGTGTNPNITATTFPTGSSISIFSVLMNAGNCGQFTVTGSGTNYFEITNASGVAENDKTLSSTGWLKVLTTTQLTWTKPTGLKYIIVEVQGAGGGGGGYDSDDSIGIGGSGSAGGYAKKLIATGTLSSTETIAVGYGGKKGTSSASPTAGGNGGTSSFGAHCSAFGGNGGLKGDSTDIPVAGGTATGGDININGGAGLQNLPGTGATLISKGGDSMLGMGSVCNVAGDQDKSGYGAGGAADIEGSTIDDFYHWGGNGIVIVTEYY